MVMFPHCAYLFAPDDYLNPVLAMHYLTWKLKLEKTRAVDELACSNTRGRLVKVSENVLAL